MCDIYVESFLRNRKRKSPPSDQWYMISYYSILIQKIEMNWPQMQEDEV